METKEEWLKLLKEGEAFCYIKPTKRIHGSGYRCFEVGYLTVGDDKKMKEKLVLNTYSDHIQLYNYNFEKVKGEMISDLLPNLDLLLDGYIRIYKIGSQENYWWGSLDFVVSSAQLSPMVDELGISKFSKKKKDGAK